MKLGSLFDGIGGWPWAGVKHGAEPVWSSEIEPFPIKVTKIRFPKMKHLGDITQINGAEIEPVDIITSGSPCQDLSVAGKRAGLEGKRSGLFMEGCRIIKEMRDATNGTYPRFAVWENVPGAFSSAEGEDFRAVLEEYCRTADPTVSLPRPPDNSWTMAGTIMGDGYSVAWRTLDAQYWGVPQRRKRIFLVADFGSRRAAEILFVAESLRGYFAESEGKREGIAGNVAGGVGAVGFKQGNSPTAGGIGYAVEQSPTLTAGQSGTNLVPAIVFACNQRDEVRDLGDKAGAIQAEPGMKQQTFIAAISFEPGAITRDMGVRAWEELAPTLRAESFDNHPAVAYAIAGNTIDRKVENGGNGAGFLKDCSYTLNTIDKHAVAIFDMTRADEVIRTVEGDKVNTLNGRMGTGGNQAQVVYQPDVSPAVTAKWAKGTGGPSGDECQNLTVVAYGSESDPEKANSLLAKSNLSFRRDTDNFATQGYKVRRLTPTECERLQGLPDGWTDIPGATDTARYKALGNGMAQPCPDYVIERIKAIMEAAK